jgi:hypothetical protein
VWRLRIGLFGVFAVLTTVLTGWGIWALVSYDPQGGRDAVGGIFLSLALVGLLLAWLLLPGSQTGQLKRR